MKRLLLFLALAYASCFVPKSTSCQVSIQFRANDGTILGTYTNVLVIFKEDASDTVAFNVSSNTVTVSASGGASTLFYQTVAQGGTAKPQESVLNFTAPFTLADSSGTHTTSVTMPNCAEGSTHNAGLVPDPGGTGGTAKFLREDCTFVAPFYQVIQAAGTPQTKRANLNFLAPLTVADNSGNNSTDIGLDGSAFVAIHGSPTPGDCAEWFDAATLEDAGAPCGSGGGGGGGNVGFSGSSLVFTSTTFVPIVGGGLSSTTEANVQAATPSAGAIANLFVQLSVPAGTGNSLAFTLRDATTDESVTCTISGASATSCSDTTDTFSASQGDLVDWKIVPSGTVTATPNVLLTFTWGATGGGGGGSYPLPINMVQWPRMSSNDSGMQNSSSVTLIPATSILYAAAKFKLVVAYVGGTTADIGNIVIKRTLPQSLAVIDTTTITFASTSSPSFNISGSSSSTPVYETSDEITLAFDTAHDYYLVLYYTSSGNNAAVEPEEVAGSVNDWVPIRGTNQAGDKTGLTTMTSITAPNSETFFQLIATH